MTKQFEATRIRLCQIDMNCVMSFCVFLWNLFSYLFIYFSSIIAWFDMNLSIWIAGDIKMWYFTLDKCMNTIIDSPALTIFVSYAPSDWRVSGSLSNKVFFFSFWSTKSFSFVKEKIYSLCSWTNLIILRVQKSHKGKFSCDIYIFLVRMSRNCSLAGTLTRYSFNFT